MAPVGIRPKTRGGATPATSPSESKTEPSAAAPRSTGDADRLDSLAAPSTLLIPPLHRPAVAPSTVIKRVTTGIEERRLSLVRANQHVQALEHRLDESVEKSASTVDVQAVSDQFRAQPEYVAAQQKALEQALALTEFIDTNTDAFVSAKRLADGAYPHADHELDETMRDTAAALSTQRAQASVIDAELERSLGRIARFHPILASRAAPVPNLEAANQDKRDERARRDSLPVDLRGPFELPQAEYRTISAADQPRVIADVRRRVEAELIDRGISVAERQRLEPLLAHLGADDFYQLVATLDPGHAKQWRKMADVQKSYAELEPKEDPKTCAYSESMRLTLHAALLLHLADPSARGDEGLYEHFIKLHTTAFFENGGSPTNLQIPAAGAAQISAETVANGMVFDTAPMIGAARDEPTHRAAAMVRLARYNTLRS